MAMCPAKKTHISQPTLQMEWPMSFKWTKWGGISAKAIEKDLALSPKIFEKPTNQTTNQTKKPSKTKEKLCEVMNVLIHSMVRIRSQCKMYMK